MGKKMCKNCDHAITFDGDKWYHSAMLHNDKCKCRKPELKEIKYDYNNKSR